MRGPGRRLTRAYAARVLGLGLLLAVVLRPTVTLAEQLDNQPDLYAALANALTPGTDRAAPRLQRATIDSTGDTTVVFAIRAPTDDPQLTRDGALADTL